MARVFFLFSLSPERDPNQFTIVKQNLREVVELVIMVVSSANCEIFATVLFGSGIPVQAGSCRIFKPSNSTARIKRKGLRGQPCLTP